jgi:hypothetical protein
MQATQTAFIVQCNGLALLGNAFSAQLYNTIMVKLLEKLQQKIPINTTNPHPDHQLTSLVPRLSKEPVHEATNS